MPENTAKYQEILVNLCNEMKKYNLAGFILPRTDEFQGEFLAPYAERLAWLSGFTGSAGSAIILHDKAVILSDGRYQIQLKNQINPKLYSTEDITKISVGEWLYLHAGVGSRIGYDMRLYTYKQIDDIKKKIKDKNIELIPLKANLIDNIWPNQPSMPIAQVSIFPDDIAGRSSQEKRCDIALSIKEQECAACLLTLSDSICWLLNIRGGDIDYSPLVFSYAILYADGTLDWFIDSEKLSDKVINILGDEVRIFPFDKVGERLGNIDGQIWVDRSSASVWFESLDIEIFDKEDPCILPKSIKSASEQDAVREAHVHDGVAIVKFLKWLDETEEPLSELSVEAKLESFRKENNAYIGASFATIAGFAGNGAIVHYRADKLSNKAIAGDGLLLVDSGGQYKWGTTDITRTIAIGTPTNEMRENYTRVLKGHIAVASACFKKGAVGKDIDALARKSLQEVGLDYAHGTGHGVGCYLCVHEISANISPRGEREFAAGMLISNEPGYYKEGEYGIRIESLVLVEDAQNSDALCFDTVTLAPFDLKLIDFDMLNAQETKWLRSYLGHVYKKLSPFLGSGEKEWLKKTTIFY